MITTQHNQRGYSIIEVLVATSVLLIAIVGPMTIAAKGLQSAQLAREQSTASFLAQEGIEVVLAMRNQATLEYIDAGGDPWDWTSSAVTSCNEVTTEGCSVAISVAGDPSVSACDEVADCKLYEQSSGRMVFTTNQHSVPTPFTRQVFITQSGSDQVEVRSVVTWQSKFAQSERSVELITVIANIYKNL